MTESSVSPIDEADLAPLRAKYGQFPIEHYSIPMHADSLEYHRRQLKRRRGEILLVLCRPNGDVLLHTKHEYPAGVYRLPTGGIDHGEPIAEAWHRELWEETQLRSFGERLLGVLCYEFVGQRNDDTPAGDKSLSDGPSVPFVSYVFELDSVTADPVPLDESEGISDFRWVPRQEMSAVAEHLKSLDHHSRELGDWGRFRAVAHEFILKVT